MVNTAPPEAHACVACLHPMSNSHVMSCGASIVHYGCSPRLELYEIVYYFQVLTCCMVAFQASPRLVLDETVCYVSSAYLLQGCISSFYASESSTWRLLSLFAGQGQHCFMVRTAPLEAHACLACLHPRSNCYTVMGWHAVINFTMGSGSRHCNDD